MAVLSPKARHAQNGYSDAEAGAGAHEPKGRFDWHVRRAPKGPTRLAIKNHIVAMIGEYVGTSLFMLFALGGTNVANIPTTNITGKTTAGQDGSQATAANTSNLLYIALSFGFSLAVNAWVFFRVSGGLFNPAVSLGMALVGALTPLRAVLLTFAQVLGGITGAAIVHAILPGTLNVRTTLAAGTSVTRGLFIEMFLTSMLMLTILLLAAEKTKATFLAPIGIGLALFIAELLGVYYTGGSLNPARSFGPSVVLHTFETYHWIYWLGPALGALLAAGFYRLLKFLEFETVLGPENEKEHDDEHDEHDGEHHAEHEHGHAHEQNGASGLALAAPAATLLGSTPARKPARANSASIPASASAPAAFAPRPSAPTTPSGGSAARRTGTGTGTAPGARARGMDVLGPGLGDLLTEAPSGRGGFDIAGHPVALGPGAAAAEAEARLVRIEGMLAALLARPHGVPGAPGVGGGAAGETEGARLASVPEGVPLLRAHGAPGAGAV